jgi:hypothetical protein
MNPEWISSVASLLAVVVAMFGVVVANRQLGGLRDSLRTDSLMAVLAMESELSAKKERCEAVASALDRARLKVGPSEGEIHLLDTDLDTAIENWLNALERLCFCINKGYVPEKDWRAEYREYVSDAVRSQPAYFQPGSRFHNILRLNARWSSE